MAKLLAQSQKLTLAMEATGFGLPFVSANFESRALASALYGCEMLASYFKGWPTAAKKLDEVQYLAVKNIIGFTNKVSLGTGGRVRVLLELRMPWRLSTVVALRIIMARARIHFLKEDTPAADVLQAAAAQKTKTWLNHADTLFERYKISKDWDTFMQRGDTTQVKKALKTWKYQEVIPRLDAGEDEWYMQQLQNVSQQLGPYPNDPPSRTQQTVALQWAPWTPAVWSFYRTWTQLRVAPGFTTPQGDYMAELEICPMCRKPAVGLVHVLGECQATARFRGRCREESPTQYTDWALSEVEDLGVLRNKVSAVGLAMAELKRALKSNRHNAT